MDNLTDLKIPLLSATEEQQQQQNRTPEEEELGKRGGGEGEEEETRLKKWISDLLTNMKTTRDDLVKQMEPSVVTTDETIPASVLVDKLQHLVNLTASRLLKYYRLWQLGAVENSKDIVSAVSIKRDVCITSRIQNIMELPLGHNEVGYQSKWAKKIYLQKLFDAIDELEVYIKIILKYCTKK